ncbi:bridge-like lipid transfer protein family member 3A [Microcaecilia unicolor]|uniref:UHRF1-binding protein 1 n=1 Tax=Microcaecilia unicolor TaxID=1415580 RepID=A0A6P7ZEV7_9AMPH|nr:UHRF1-binding protein 1 [Microcaecilia unicolor]
MAGLIKKQILKHLSRFTKNLSPDKINLSTLKGEGQLTNLELDEEVLQNVLDLPTWLAITRVFCNKAAIRIQWTKLKTHPICLYLDKVEVEMRTCEEPRPPNGQSPIALAAGQSEYGFAEKVVEGMFIVVNSITIKVHARAFHASFELWQLQGYSVNPNWQQSDLRFTRITDRQRGEVLTFKELTWQTLRIEADATDSGDQDAISTPLRLITNQGRIQITLKRRMKDCDVVATKLMFLLDDLLWVLTDLQLKAMMKYAKSLSEVMEKSAQQRKSMAPEPVQITPSASSAQQSWSQAFSGSQSTSTIGQYFEKYDMKEPSYHLLISRLDLHICDDSQTRESGAARHGVTGGAMQLTFRKIAFDYYPFHWAGDNCKHWVRHCQAMETRAHWATELMNEFQNKIENLLEAMGSASKTPARESTLKKRPETLFTPEKGQLGGHTDPLHFMQPRRPAWNRLRSSCVVVRVDDLDIHQVSTASKSSKKPSTLLSSIKKSCSLPERPSAIHIEFTEYYFPDSPEFPVPSSNLYLQLHDLSLMLDPISLLWINVFCLDLYRSLQQFKAIYKLEDSKRDEHVDVRLDSFGLKLSIPVEKKVSEHRDRPQGLSIHTTTMTATNTRHATHCQCLDLQNIFRTFAASEFFHSSYTQFPKSKDNFGLLHTLFLQHAYKVDSVVEYGISLKPAVLKPSASEDLWSIYFTLISLNFYGAQSSKDKPLNFIEPFPLSVWACLPSRFKQVQDSKAHSPNTTSEVKMKSSTSFGRLVKHPGMDGECQKSKLEQNVQGFSKTPESGVSDDNSAAGKADNKEVEALADIHVLVHSTAPVKMRLSHYQYLVLLRMKETLQLLQEQLTEDTQQLTGSPVPSKTSCVGVLFNSAELALLFPPVPNPSLEPQAIDSDTTSLLESELSPSGSREVLVTEEKEFKSDIGSDQRTSNPLKNLEGSADRTMQSEDILPRSQSEGTLDEAEVASLPGDSIERGQLEEAHEVVEALNSKDQKFTSILPSSSSLTQQTLNSGDALFSEQGDLLPLKSLEELTSALHLTKDATRDALHMTMDLTKEAVSLTKDAFNHSKDKMASTMQRMLALPPVKEPASKAEDGVVTPLSSGNKLRFFSMIRTTSQQSFDSTSLDGSVSGLEDRVSIDSDGSEGFVMLMDSESSFEPGVSGQLVSNHTGTKDSPTGPSDGMYGAKHDRRASSDLNSSTSQSVDDVDLPMVSVLVLKIGNVNCAIETRGDDLTVAVQAADVVPEKFGNISMRQFLHRDPAVDDIGMEKLGTEPSRTQPEVYLRFEAGPSAAVHSPLAVQNGFLHFLISNYSAELMMSTLTHLGPFLEDELFPEVIPMKIEVVDTKITLKDDGPQVYPSSLGPIPITLAMDHVLVQRKDDGVFYITAVQGGEQALLKRFEQAVHDKKIPQEITAVAKKAGTAAFSQKEAEGDARLQQELNAVKVELARVNQDKERLLEEIWKYNPLFQL